MKGNVVMQLSEEFELNSIRLSKIIDNHYKIHNIGVLSVRMGGLLCRLIITMPIGLIVVLFGLIMILIALPFSIKSKKMSKQLVTQLILDFKIYNILEISYYLPNVNVIEITTKIINKDSRFLHLTIAEDGIILIEKEDV